MSFSPAPQTPWSSPSLALAFIGEDVEASIDMATITKLLRAALDGPTVLDRPLSPMQVSLLNRHRVLPLVSPESLPESSTRNHRSLAVLAMELDRVAREVLGALTEESIETRLLKGMATSRLDYQSPDLRHSGDIDLLVRPVDYERAVKAVMELSFSRITPPQFDESFSKGVGLKSAAGIEVDIHSRLTVHGRAGTAALFADATPIADLGTHALSPEGRLVHAAIHLFFTEPEYRRLSGLVDIFALRESGVDLMKARDLANALEVEGAVYCALAVEAQLASRALDTLSDWKKPSLLESVAYGRSRRRQWAEQVHRIAGFESWSTRAAYLRQKALPSAEVRSHRGGWLGYLRRGLR